MTSISVIVPNYNYSEYIIQTLDSIRLQEGMWCVDLYIVDDNSTDNSIELINNWLQNNKIFFNNITFLRLKINAGKTAALNEVIPLLASKYTIILDSDDFLKKDYFTEMHCHFVNSSIENIGFVYSDCILINSIGDIIGKGMSTKFSSKLIESCSYIPEPALTLTKALQDAFPLNHKIKVGTKHHKWKKICKAGWNGVHVEKELFFYRMHAKNLSGIGNKINNEEGIIKERLLKGYWPSEMN